MTAADSARERLRHAAWLGTAASLLDVLDGRGGSTRVVGGIVRDTLLGLNRSTTDIDMATVLEPQEVTDRAVAAGLAVYPTGVEHGTVTVVAGEISVEVTTLREDVETFGRHARVVFGTDWNADARRRDFTMNALYAGPDGELFDPLGGLEDCLARRVRFIGDADARIAEDRLRVYRYFRFCATHGEERFEDEALAACERAAGDLNQLAAERIGAEMLKLLDAPGCAATIRKMTEIAVLDAALISPQAHRALVALETTHDGNAHSRMGILVASGVSITTLKQLWRLSNAVCKAVKNLVAAADLASSEKLRELAYRYPDLTDQALAVAGALAGWPSQKLTALWNDVSDVVPGVFPLSGEDLLQQGVEGKAVGEWLRRLEEDWIESRFSLGRQALLDRVRLP